MDVHKKLIVACLRQGRKQEVREFGATTRELVGYRKSLLKEQSAELNRVQKMLEGANIKLSDKITNINGVSGRNLLKAILSGEKIDLAKITDMRGLAWVSSWVRLKFAAFSLKKLALSAAKFHPSFALSLLFPQLPNIYLPILA